MMEALQTFKQYRINDIFNQAEKDIIESFNRKLLYGRKTLEEIFGFDFELNQRERNIIISIIQWFASPVGDDFIEAYIANKNEVAVDLFKDMFENSVTNPHNYIFRDIVVFGLRINDIPNDYLSDKENKIFYKVISWLDTKDGLDFVKKNKRYKHA